LAYSDGDPPQVVPMKAAHDLLPLGERLKSAKRLMMNSRLPKKIASPRGNPLHVTSSPSVATTSANE
jgi:hypothetical protein